MSLLLFTVVVLLVVALCVYLLRMASPDANVTNIGTILLIIVGVLVVAHRAGVGF